jgi:NAD+ kinase
MKTIALFSKPNSPQAWGVLNEVVSWARQKGLQTLVGPGASGGWTGSNWDEAYCSDVRAQADMALAIGGDGTLLGVARSLFGWDKPLLGVNLGHLGFLTDIAAKDIEAMLDALVAGAYTIENRILLEASKAEQTAPALAFNDVVFKGGEGSLAEFNVFVDGQSISCALTASSSARRQAPQPTRCLQTAPSCTRLWQPWHWFRCARTL